MSGEQDNTTGAAAFVQSELFARAFREGMALVEETANYLDGDGREESQRLNREGSLSYASASMRLTTQLMQIASWLLVMRAVREGEISLTEAADPKYRIDSSSQEPDAAPSDDEMPERLIGLVSETQHLFARLGRLDADLFGSQSSSLHEGDAAAQQQALLQAFGSGS
ncbi:MAG: DUF1465 family protein [Pseudomonadota bacterium]